MSESVLFTVNGGVARLTLNRPARLNAINVDMAYAWRDVTADAVSRDDVRAIVLDAAGPAFCSGGDVIDMATTMGSGTEITALARVINEGILSLTTSKVPVVAAAHGTTAGGGLGILLATDYAVVGASSRVGSLYANVGLTPDLSVSAHLARAIGERRALQLVLQDRLLSADEAREWGLVAEVISAPTDSAGDAAAEADAVRARAEQVARFWADGASAAYGEAKQLVRSQPERSFSEQLELEARTIGAALDGDEASELVRRFAAASAGARSDRAAGAEA